MSFLVATLAALKALLAPPAGPDCARGSVTIEHVLWAVAVIAIVGIVVTAITTYVHAQAGLIN